MNFSCDHCQRRYVIPDEKIRGRTVKVRCKNCQNILVLSGEAADDLGEEELTRAVPMSELLALQRVSRGDGTGDADPTRAAMGPGTGIAWFVLLQGNQQGPLPIADVSALIRRQQVTPRTYVWHQGMREWRRASEVSEIAPYFAPVEASPAPPPREAPPPVEMRAPPPNARASSPAVPRREAARSPSTPAPAAAQFPWDVPTRLTRPPVSETKPAVSAVAPQAKAPPQRRRTPMPVADPQPSEEAPDAATDPFERIGPAFDDDGPIGEQTAFIIAQAGTQRRNPPWKIASLALGLIAVPVLLVLLLSRLHVGPLAGSKTTAAGSDARGVAGSSQGTRGLKDLLLGRKPPPPPPPPEHARATTASRPSPGPPPATPPPAAPEKNVSPELAHLYASNTKPDVGPPALKSAAPIVKSADPHGGPGGEELKRVVDQTQPAFQFCIEQHVRKHPNFRGGRVNLIATVGTSGIVKGATIDRRDIDGSELGSCLKAKARRMVFASFPGDEVDLEIPLILTTTL